MIKNLSRNFDMFTRHKHPQLGTAILGMLSGCMPLRVSEWVPRYRLTPRQFIIVFGVQEFVHLLGLHPGNLNIPAKKLEAIYMGANKHNGCTLKNSSNDF